jgi:hypothetical protein
MRPVFQDKFYDPTVPPHQQRGNCWTAAIASLLELDLHDVPNFVQIDVDGGQDWYLHTIKFLNEHGRTVVQTFDGNDVEFLPREDEYYLVTGQSPRGGGTIYHVVVFQNGKMVHDPHPDNAGLLNEQCIYVVRPL